MWQQEKIEDRSEVPDTFYNSITHQHLVHNSDVRWKNDENGFSRLKSFLKHVKKL